MAIQKSRTRLSRREFLKLSGATAATLGLSAACASAPTATPPKAAPPPSPVPAVSTAAPTAAPAPKATEPVAPSVKRGGILRVAHTGETLDWDPHLLTIQKFPLLYQVYSTLIMKDPKTGKIENQLAESWAYAQDGSYLELKLRKGVKFHSGKEFTAKDVAFNLERAKDPKLVTQLTRFFGNVTFESADPYTVRLKLSRPVPYLLDALDQFFIVDEASIADIKNKANGTGPFKLVEWSPGSKARLVRNEAYWKPGRPYLDEVQVVVLSDVPSMVANLEGANVDIAEQVPAVEHERLRKNPNLRIEVSPNHSVIYDFVYGVTKAPLDNKKVRQAFAYAMDRKRFVDTIMGGVGMPKCTPWPPTSLAYDAEQDKRYEFNLDKAKALLAEAGWKPDTEVPVLTTSQAWPDITKFAQIVQADMAKIGVRLKLEGNRSDGCPRRCRGEQRLTGQE